MNSRHLKVVPPPAQLRVAIYARVSSDQQAERQTIDSQLSELKASARRDGYEVQDGMLFIDNGQSGTTLIRPALERLRDMVALSAIDVVYVHAPDRLARSYAHQVLLLEEFAHADTRVMFLNRPIGDSPEDNLLLQLQGMFAEYERAKLLERSRRGKRHRAEAGAVSVLARAPFGYRYIGREAGGGEARYDIDENAARVVRQIFAWVGQERLT
jgi:site-specific DNA recombinase